MSKPAFDVIVAGAGPAGLIAACLAAIKGFVAAMVTGPVSARPDPRTVALMTPSLSVLEECGLWPATLKDEAAPLRQLRLIDDTGAFLSAPEVTFAASELGLAAFGWNIPLSLLKPALEKRARELGVVFHEQAVTGFSAEVERAIVTLADGASLDTRLVLAADGRSSFLRQAVGIETVSWSYEQTAIALSFAHSGAHHDISSEYHKPHGPFTTVPLPGRRSSLVWMVEPNRAAALLGRDERALAGEIQAMNHGDLGLVSDLGPRQSFPMAGMRALVFAKDRVILLGEAAHVVPPIGAQGLNMSFRDARDAVALIAASKDGDFGAARVLSGYDLMRQRDVRPRQAVIDLMNRSLISGYLPMEAGRAAGLAALGTFGPLRRFAMSLGLGAPSSGG